MISPGTIETDNREVPFWSQTSLIPRMNNFTSRNITTISEKPQFPRQTQIAQNQEGTTTIPAIRELLQKIYCLDGSKA